MVEAIRVHKVGGPDVLQVEQVEVGDPGPGEVRIKHHAIGLNYLDVYFREGAYATPLPFTPGNEAAGEIVAVGKGVKHFKEGDRVAYGTSPPGAYCAERIMDPKVLVDLPKKISYDTGAAMMLKGLTAQYLLRRTFKVKEGHTILVHAAAGGVGLIMCQWARHLGAKVIGTVGSKEKAAIAKKAGADHVILYREENFVERVAEITKGEKCDVVYDGIGKATFMGSLDCLRPLGTLALFGAASGPVEPFDLNLLSKKGSLFLTRPTLFTYAGSRDDLVEMAEDLMHVVAKGHVEIPINARFPLAKVADAHRALEGRETTGSTILIP